MERIDWPVATLGVALLVVTGLLGARSLTTGGQQSALQQQLNGLKAHVATLQAELNADDARLAAIHRTAQSLASSRHVTHKQLRRLAQQSRPRPVTPAPGPTVTVTRTAPPQPRATVTRTTQPPCPGVKANGGCIPTHPPTASPSIHLH